MNSVRCGSSFHGNPPAPSLLFHMDLAAQRRRAGKEAAEKLRLSTPAWQSYHPAEPNTLGKGSTSTASLLKRILAPTVNQLLGHLQVGWFAFFVKHSQGILFPKLHRKLPLSFQNCSPYQKGVELRQLCHALRWSPHVTAGC